MIALDGSQGEGGGQILRSALALSLVTGTPFRIDNIRAGRPRPGLMRQHLTAVEAAAAIGAAETSGASVGSRSLTFAPTTVKPGDYTFSVGTAGSATLVLQTVLPSLLTADRPSSLVLEGGTHNPSSPPFDFLAKAFLPLVGRMGAHVEATLERAGFYPAGGGRFRVTVAPTKALAPLELEQRGAVRAKRVRALIANLPRAIGEHELHRFGVRTQWDSSTVSLDAVPNSIGPGNALIAEVESEHVTEVFTAFGEKQVRAETVANLCADEVLSYLATDAPVGPHLADQLVLMLALAGGGTFRTTKPTQHTHTQLAVIPRFVGTKISCTEETGGGTWRFVAGQKGQ
jgi:RNA 3'-terminal phosphate cyclase (ATP)